jgi:threonyl-tRNA synthetase
VRADVDDRKKNVGDKINAAREDWCPYVVVLGPKELQDKNWSVKCRATGDERVMSPAECMSMIASQTVGMPFRPFHPLLLSKRPKF